jgi:outer membrane receptor protein involved in Fe transport
MRMRKLTGVTLLVKRVTIASLACVCLLAIEMPATAQQAPATTTAPDTELQEIVVTGSMVKRPNAETAEAVTILKADALKDQGIVNVEQAINTLTAANPSVNIASAVGSFTSGGTYANLRGLGNTRTLVVLDGQRLAVNAFNGNAVDLSAIPFSAIDSVQVLREGASALYGSDAIAGVINFITKKTHCRSSVAQLLYQSEIQVFVISFRKSNFKLPLHGAFSGAPGMGMVRGSLWMKSCFDVHTTS